PTKKWRRQRRRRGYGEESKREAKAGGNPPTSRRGICAARPPSALIQINVADFSRFIFGVRRRRKGAPEPPPSPAQPASRRCQGLRWRRSAPRAAAVPPVRASFRSHRRKRGG